ncbi:MAG TPA: hypothetical protein VFO93_08435 [Hymenobacter sp.]|uniref:hypothetical protein n=1 Tax=Hymenobacter sp. TaxID=1898978 RepID=UPI002D7FEE31|nr:hypothetical protein [Hymenobacter sp.]HET9503555.1 hypothetical protein [Hymenobacter sp.]
MKNRLLIIGAVLLVAVCSICCNCKWYETQEQLQQLFDASDVVFVGLPIRDINPAQRRNQNLLGYDALFKVISQQKGIITYDTVLILQDDSNCARLFRPADTIIVFGRHIKRLSHKRRTKEYSKEYSLFDYESSVFQVGSLDKNFQLYKRLHKHYAGVHTSGCVSFPIQYRPSIAAFLRAKRQ